MSDCVYQLEVTMRHIHPAIWRRVRVPGATTLARLHDVLQIAFGWTSSHLHQFRVGRECFGPPDPDGERPELHDERRVRLAQVADAKSKLVYDYDFGDGWEHEIVVERVDAVSEPIPTCIDGRRSRPPEDCGGPHGYEHLLEVLADADHPEHAEMREWAGPYFHPEEFDRDLANRHLRELGVRWQRAAARKARALRAKWGPAND